MNIFLGIDPGTATTGYGAIRTTGKGGEFELADFGIIATKKTLNDAERLAVLAKDLRTIFRKFEPEAVGVEKLYFEKNQKTAITVSQARGVVLLTAAEHRIPIYEFTPLEVKKFICGYGKADKKQVQYVIQKTFALRTAPKPDDAADALAIALCTAHQARRKKLLQ